MTGYQLPLSLTRHAVSREVLALHTTHFSKSLKHRIPCCLPGAGCCLLLAWRQGGRQAGRSDGDCGLLRACAALKVTALEEPSSCFPREILAHGGRVFWHTRNSDLFTPELSCSHSNRTVSQQDMPGAVENSQSHGECRSFPPLVDQILTHGTEEHTPVLEKIEGNDLCSACW